MHADLVITHALEWPSLTVQWLPNRQEVQEGRYSKQNLILGTHTSEGEQNYLMRAEVHLPLEDTETDNRCVSVGGPAWGCLGHWVGSPSSACMEMQRREKPGVLVPEALQAPLLLLSCV